MTPTLLTALMLRMLDSDAVEDVSPQIIIISLRVIQVETILECLFKPTCKSMELRMIVSFYANVRELQHTTYVYEIN